jgi:hypothetical protein
MGHMMTRIAIFVSTVLVATGVAYADFQYQETTKITGGSLLSMMRMMGRFSGQAKQSLDPITQSVYLKGNRMAHIGKDSSEIIDVDKETFTRIDHTKREYSVMTFEQMKKAMEEAAKRLQQQMEQQKASQPTPEAARADISFNAKVRDGGQSKQISGLDTKLMILTMEMEAKDKQSGQTGAMAFTSDMWMTPDIPGYDEVREFQRKMAVKMGMMAGPGMSNMAGMMQPSMMKGMGDLVKEGSKLKGMPVLTVTRVGATADGQPLPSAAEAPLPPSKDPEMPNMGQLAGEAAASTATHEAQSQLGSAGALGRIAGGALGGGLGGFGRKKKQEQPQAQQQPSDAKGQQALASVLMEAQTEKQGFSSASVDNSVFNVPAGYKQVESEMLRRTR